MAKKFISYALLTKYDGLLKAWVNGLINDVNGDAAALKTLVETLIGSDNGKSARTIANEEMAATLLVDPETGEKNFQTLQALAKYLEDHPEEVADILASIKAVDDKVGNLPTGENAPATVVAYITKVAADLAAEVTRADNAEKANKGLIDGLTTRVEDIEEMLGDGEDSIPAQIEAAKLAAISTAAEDATTKVDGLKNTVVSSTSGEDVVVTLGGTVGAPTVNVSIEFATDKDIDDLFKEEEAGE